jgi:hypothetical protein
MTLKIMVSPLEDGTQTRINSLMTWDQQIFEIFPKILGGSRENSFS